MQNRFLVRLVLVCAPISLVISACTWEKPQIAAEAELTCDDYPDDVRQILVDKCATAGCHNSKSYEASSGLDLTNWKTMKQGNDAGAVVIPGNPDYSTLFTFCNTYDDLGFTGQLPKMPVNAAVLSHDEMVTLRNWINNGAQNRCGELMFPFDALRRKFVIANQACDQIEVFDIKSRSVMKFFETGHTPGATPPESPHQIRYTPDGKYYLVGFYSSLLDTAQATFGSKNYVQRYDAETDLLVDEVEINNNISGTWGAIAISPDSKFAYAVDYNSGRVAIIKLDNANGKMSVTTTPNIGPLVNQHGIAVSKDGSKLYITGQSASAVVYITGSSVPGIYSPQTINVGGSAAHEIIFAPDYSKYFVTCQNSAEVRVFNTSNNALIAVIPVGALPQEFAMSFKKPYLFVSCTDEPTNGTKGAIYVIDYNTLSLVTSKIFSGTQPHGLAVDDVEEVVYVANRNNDATGTTTHHQNSCGDKNNGYLTIIDMNTLQLVPGYKYELGQNPYTVAVRP